MTATVPRSDIGIASTTLSVRRQRAEEEPADERGQDQRQAELELDLVDRLLDEDRGVGEDLDLHALGQAALDLGDLVADRLGDGDGVGAALLQDAERLERLAVELRQGGDVGEAVLDERDVLEVDRRVVDLAHDQLLERVEIDAPRRGGAR